MGYKAIYDTWKADPQGWWMEQAQRVHWDTFPETALSDDGTNWFPDGMTNTCYNAVDRHVEAGRGEQTAIIYDSPVTDTKAHISYAELQDRCAMLAGALKARGVGHGDRVVIYMPMVPEAVVAMLACTRIGAIHSVVFGGFAASELATRIDDATPKAIIAGSCGIEPNRVVEYKPLLDAAIEQATHKPETCIVLQRPQAEATLVEGRDVEWHASQEGVEPAPCVSVRGDHPCYILYTSGTTGQPKGVVRPTGGHIVALNWTMKAVYNVDPGEVFWAASDVGWVVGHSYICYAPLIHGNTTVVFEGKPVGTPDPSTFWRVIAEHGVKSFFTAPTAFRAIRKEDPKAKYMEGHDISGLRALYLAGERADPDTIEWAQKVMGVPVYDHWWQTESGYPMVANPTGIEALPVKIGSPTVPMPGYEVHILAEDGAEKPRGELGSIAIKLPLPPGTLPTLWQADDRYRKAYLERFDGYYNTGDAGMMDEDGYLWIMARTDDVINVAGHRLSTGLMEEVLAAHPDVAECAVIGVKDALKGQLPMGFVTLQKGTDKSDAQIAKELVALVREKIGPVAAFKLATVVDRLPKTRSGKILRKTMAQIADGEQFKTPATIDDPAILDEIGTRIQILGYPAA
ncbi:Acetyl-coenzyme A synthetase [Rhodobacteraceae bacterium THAF1]|uniref:propionyl-CoA synthetase n=1 Tax=Palleronia sp. THAF1 TaxID=2587842 RepID=UPI000F3FA264|nr:propionyl-CoA synthetase [Palleronia sp. THAF1]QFU09604.1 Acetyl-coenzyme A synthetase [Palleronia sp. THAF1]VDC17495.1 Acetyl-coenzyme A synthetase [Rhodobacteraceae bacterium THAF1]